MLSLASPMNISSWSVLCILFYIKISILKLILIGSHNSCDAKGSTSSWGIRAAFPVNHVFGDDFQLRR